jgi:hypothetical protein
MTFVSFVDFIISFSEEFSRAIEIPFFVRIHADILSGGFDPAAQHALRMGCPLLLLRLVGTRPEIMRHLKDSFSWRRSAIALIAAMVELAPWLIHN